jgi:hypothetical protein
VAGAGAGAPFACASSSLIFLRSASRAFACASLSRAGRLELLVIKAAAQNTKKLLEICMDGFLLEFHLWRNCFPAP